MTPETRYARLQGDRIAYQVLGDGPPDLVLTPGSFAHIDIGWEDPGISLFCRMLASFCRLIVFDRRGTGLSDPLPPDPLPPWESYAQDLAAVLDEVDAERAALLAEIDAGPTAICFAATQPERTRTHQRPDPVPHHRQVRGRRGLPDRDSGRGRRGAAGPDGPILGL